MSWSNPSQQEAQEAYDAAKKKYDSTAEEYLRLSKQKEQYESEASAAYRGYADADTKLQRLRKLEFTLQRILRYFTTSNDPGGDTVSTGGLINSAVVESKIVGIETANSLKQCIVCTGMPALSFARAGTTKYVDEDADSHRAKQLVRQELKRVLDLMKELDTQTRSSAEDYNALVRKAAACADEMTELKKTMDSCAFDMDHYKKYI